MQTKATLRFTTTEARSAMNVIAEHSTSIPVKSLWVMLSQRAIRAAADKLEFADGSVLRFDERTCGFLAT